MHYDFFLVIVGEHAAATAQRLLGEGVAWSPPPPGFGVFNPPGEPSPNASLAVFLEDPDEAVVHGVIMQNRSLLYVRGSVATLNGAERLFRGVMSQCRPEEFGMGLAMDELSRTEYAVSLGAGALQHPSNRVSFRSSVVGKTKSHMSSDIEADWIRVLCGQGTIVPRHPLDRCDLPEVVRTIAATRPIPQSMAE
jgi:hypothetical protein